MLLQLIECGYSLKILLRMATVVASSVHVVPVLMAAALSQAFAIPAPRVPVQLGAPARRHNVEGTTTNAVRVSMDMGEWEQGAIIYTPKKRRLIELVNYNYQ